MQFHINELKANFNLPEDIIVKVVNNVLGRATKTATPEWVANECRNTAHGAMEAYKSGMTGIALGKIGKGLKPYKDILTDAHDHGARMAALDVSRLRANAQNADNRDMLLALDEIERLRRSIADITTAVGRWKDAAEAPSYDPDFPAYEVSNAYGSCISDIEAALD